MKIVNLNPKVFVGDHFHALFQVILKFIMYDNYRQQLCLSLPTTKAYVELIGVEKA